MPTARIVVDLTWGIASGSPGVNVWHARADSIDQFNADFDALSQLIRQFYADINVRFPGTLTISQNGEAEGVGDDTGTLYSTTPWTMGGTGTDDILPPANCILVNWRAATGGRSGRGKTFLGPVCSSTAEDNGTPDEAARTDVQNAANDLVANSGAFGNGAVGVYSRTQDTFRDFVSAAVPNYFAVLRSRRD